MINPFSSQFLQRMLSALVGITLFLPMTGGTDAPELLAGEVSVTAVSVSAGVRGQSCRLRFTLQNDTASSLTFLGIESPVVENAALMARVNHSRAETLDSIAVPSGETLELNTSHLWVEFNPLTRTLSPGDEIPVTLQFSQGTLTVIAHVHES